MITYTVAFLLAAMVGTVMTLLVRNRALAWGLLDQANSSRKVHTNPVPRLGGLAIVSAFFAPLTALLLIDRSGVGLAFQAQETLWVGLFVGGLAIAALGFYDDVMGAGAKVKFLVQFAVAAGLYGFGFRIELLSVPFLGTVSLGMFAFPFTLIWMVGVVNALNLIDGLDGLAGGVAFFAAATNFVLAFARQDVVLCLVMAALAGAILGFLVFNSNPASIFMGDTGSLFLGFVLAAVSIKTSTKSGTAVALLVPIIALGLPIMDTLLAMVRRGILGRPVFSADREHIHHRLMSRLGLSHRRAVLLLYAVCCLFALTALALHYASNAQTALLLGGIGLIVIVLMRKLGYLDLRRAAGVGAARRRNGQLRELVRDTSELVGRAISLPQIWDAVRPLGEVLDISELTLELVSPGRGGQDGLAFKLRRDAGTALPLSVVLELKVGEDHFGTISLQWQDGRHEVDRDEELALEVLADVVAKAARKIQVRAMTPPPNVVRLRP